MGKTKTVQLIKNNGKPEWAVIPYEEFLRLKEVDEISRTMSQLNKDYKSGKEELLPNKFAKRLMDGENTIKVWREHRGLTQKKLANTVGISTPYLSQLENEARAASIEVLKKIASALNISIEDII